MRKILILSTMIALSCGLVCAAAPNVREIQAQRAKAFLSLQPGPGVAHGPSTAWDTYRVILWIKPPKQNVETYLERAWEMGVNTAMLYAGKDPKTFRETGTPYYIENIVRGLYIKNTPEYEKAWKLYWEKRSPTSLIRIPCLHSKEWIASEKKHIREILTECLPDHPVAYDIRDEASVTVAADPLDFCFSRDTLSAFRTWLKGDYGSLAALNAEWGTDYKTWNEVVPMTADAIEGREIARMNVPNFAPWADHRTFMDITFARTIRWIHDEMHRIDPFAVAGIQGVQLPSAYGGFDYARLIPQLDWCELNAFRGSREIVRSFAPGKAVVCTVFERSAKSIKQRLWYLALHGDRGCIVWPFDQYPEDGLIDQTKKDYPLTSSGKSLQEALWELRRGGAELLMGATHQVDPIAVYYSQPSIQADWMFESQVDGKTWPRRTTAHEAVYNLLAKDREGLFKLIEDLGFQYQVVSSGDVVGGALEKRGFRVLFLPRVMALSDAEAAAIRSFVEKGGTVVADLCPGMMDEHCRSRQAPILDDVFAVQHTKGIQFSVDPVELHIQATDFAVRQGYPKVSIPIRTFPEDGLRARGQPLWKTTEKGSAFFCHRFGEGLACYLNMDFSDYLRIRLIKKDSVVFQSFMATFMRNVGLAPAITVADKSGHRPAMTETHVFRGPIMDIVGVMRNPVFQISEELRDLASEAATETEKDVVVTFPYAAHVYEVLSGTYAGVTSKVKARMSLYRPLLFALLPYQVKKIIVACPSEIRHGASLPLHITLETAPSAKDLANHVITCDVFRKEDRHQMARFAFAARLKDGAYSSEWDLSKLAEGEYILAFRDIVSGISTECPLRVKP